MNLFDFYFRQIVTQTVMDWVFEQAQQADHNLSTDNALTGITDGLECTENHLGADLSVDIAGGIGYSSDGARIFVPDLLTNLDCSVDEYGVSTAVTTGGNERWLGIFARFTRDLQDPQLDGNGLEVYTKQLESFELIVHQGAEDTIGLASRPALLTNAVLLADVNLVQGQTTITTASHIFTNRRQDWIRAVGTSLPDFVHGNSRDALEDLFSVVDTWSGGGSPFSFTSTWFGGLDVLGPTFPPDLPATVFQALDAIVYDLAVSTGGIVGASRIGMYLYTAPFGYVSWPATSVSTVLTEIADALDGHINGAAPEHPASAITTVEWDDWFWLKVSTATGFSAGVVTNEDDEQATLVTIYETEFGVWFLLSGQTGTGWNNDKGLCMGGTYSSPPDAMILDDDIQLYDILTGNNLDEVLNNLTIEMYRRPRLDQEALIQARRTHTIELQAAKALHAGSITGGADDYHGPVFALQNLPAPDGSDHKWPCGYDNQQTNPTNDNYVDICKGWNYRDHNHCAFAIGDDPTVDMFYTRYDDPDDFIREQRGNMTTDVSGTLLTAPATPVAIASNGPQVFVLVDPDGTGTSADLYAYDARYMGDIEPLIFQWKASFAKAIGTRKANSRLVCNDTYVWILFGNEDVNTGTPLGRVNAADGLGPIYGAGDGTAIGGTITPDGGLAVCGGSTPTVFYTAGSLSGYTLIPATWALTSTGLAEMSLTAESREVIIAGRWIVCPVFHYGAPSANPFAGLLAWDFQDNVKSHDLRIYNPTDITVADVLAAFDGTTIWVKFAQGNKTHENHVVVGIHPTQFIPDEIVSVTADDRFLATKPRRSGGAYGQSMGRFIAWGPALWHIPLEAEDNEIFWQPGQGLFFK